MSNIRQATLAQGIWFTLFRMSAVFTVCVLIGILLLLLKTGYHVLDWHFLTAEWQQSDITKGGIFPAILGSVYLGLGITLISFPLGIGTAVFLTEYSQHSVWSRIIQLAIRNLAGVPSVVFGLFGLSVFVYLLSFGTSLISAILTLSVMTMPWIIASSAEALESVPQKFRDSSMALGATKWQTIRHIIIPSALPGCITGGIIGIARALGETAPIILIGATFFLTQLPSSPFDKYMALPYHVFILATQHASPHAREYAAGTSLVLMALTFVMASAAIALRYFYRKRRIW